jgi:hypothetical protein
MAWVRHCSTPDKCRVHAFALVLHKLLAKNLLCLECSQRFKGDFEDLWQLVQIPTAWYTAEPFGYAKTRLCHATQCRTKES